MRTLIVLYLILFSTVSLGLPPKLQLPCRSQVEKESAESSDRQWFRVTDPGPGILAYRAPTASFGHWHELQFSNNLKFARLMKISDTQVKTIEWDESCKMTSDTGAWNAGARQDTTIQLFNDSDLKELIKNKDSGMVYVWDPGMVYSSKFFTQFKKVADKNKMRFTSLLAPNSNPQIAREVAAQNNFQLDARQVASSEMLMRFTSAHYPKTFIYNNGQLAVYPIMGVTSEEELNALVAKGKKQLK